MSKIQTVSTGTLPKARRKRTRALRNLVRRNRVWHFKIKTAQINKYFSLHTEDEELAKAKRDEELRKITRGELDKVRGTRSKAATLAQVFAVYRELAGITLKAARGNISSMMMVCRRGLDQPELQPEEISLDVFSPKLKWDYQDRERARYEKAAGSDENARRMARDLANRTTRSTIGQAQSIFAKANPKKRSRDLITQYQERGMAIPAGVKEFCATVAVGTMESKVYQPANDAVLRVTFERIEALKEADPEVYQLFWLALGTGGRKCEVVNLTTADFMEVEGALWVKTKRIDKNGHPICVPVVYWPVHPASSIVPAVLVRKWLEGLRHPLPGPLLGKEREGNVRDDVEGVPTLLFAGEQWRREDALPKRLNEFLTACGWADEKKLHGLRAFIGSQLFEENPCLAQWYLRHTSLTTTERFYSHFAKAKQWLKFRPVVLPNVGKAA